MTMKWMVAVLVALLFIVFSPYVFGGEFKVFEGPPPVELTIAGALDAVNNDDVDGADWTFELDTTVGFFITGSGAHELGGFANIFKSEGSDMTGVVGGFYNYNIVNFGIDYNMLWFVEGNLGMGVNDFGDGYPIVYGGAGGVKWFLGSTALIVKPFYTRWHYANYGLNNYGVKFGVALYL